MSAEPIDFSQYAQGGKQIDFSAYAKGSAQSQPDTGVAAGIKRGLSNIVSLPSAVYHAFTDPSRPGEPSSDNMAEQAALGVRRLLIEPQIQTYNKAAQETTQPGDNDWNNATERAHADKIAAMVPVVGPLADNLVQRYLAGDKSGAVAELATYITAPKAAEAATDATKAAIPPVIRGTARVTNAALDKAPTAVAAAAGAALGHATGIPGAGEVGAIAGATIGKSLKGKISVPGENFGLPPANAPLSNAIEQAVAARKAAVQAQQPEPQPAYTPPPPESGAGAEARAYFEQKLAQRKAAQQAQPQPEAQPETTSAPSEDDVAKGMGYKSASQAQQRLGPQQWQQTYNKITQSTQEAPTEIKTPAQAQQAVSDLVDKVAPSAPLRAKAEIDFALRKGDVDQAQKMLDDILEDKEFQQNNQADLQNSGTASYRYQQRLNRAKSSADANKGSLLTAQQVVDSMPAPYADMEANKLLGYEGRRTIAEATQARKDARQPQVDMNAPWGGTKPYTEAVKQFIRLYYGEGNSLKVRPTQQR